MPYIENERRDQLDVYGDIPHDAGELTFVLQVHLREYLEHNGLRYQQLAECLGALEGAKLDLIERVINPYEVKKREENGDVWTGVLP